MPKNNGAALNPAPPLVTPMRDPRYPEGGWVPFAVLASALIWAVVLMVWL